MAVTTTPPRLYTTPCIIPATARFLYISCTTELNKNNQHSSRSSLVQYVCIEGAPRDSPRRVKSPGGATPILAKLIKLDPIREFCKLPDLIREFTQCSFGIFSFLYSAVQEAQLIKKLVTS